MTVKSKQPKHFHVALGIFLGTLAGYVCAHYFFSTVSNWALLVSSLAGGIIGWIAADPLRFGRGLKRASSKHWRRFKLNPLQAILGALLGAHVAALFAAILYIGISGSGGWPSHLEIESLVQTGLPWLNMAIDLYVWVFIAAVVPFFFASVNDNVTSKRVNERRARAGETSDSETHFALMAFFWPLVPVGGIGWWLLKFLVLVLVLVVGNIPSFIKHFWLFLKRLVRYTLSREAVIACVGAATFAPIALVSGSPLLWAVVGAVIGELVYRIISIKLLHLDTPVKF